MIFEENTGVACYFYINQYSVYNLPFIFIQIITYSLIDIENFNVDKKRVFQTNYNLKHLIIN